MTEQQKRSLFFSATGKVATLNPFEYFIFCKGMDAEREACAKVCDAYGMPDGTSETARVLAVCIRARTLHEVNRAAQQNGEEL